MPGRSALAAHRLQFNDSMARFVDEIMNRELFSLHPEETVRDALAYLLALGVSGCPVVDDEGLPVGMIALRDVMDVPDAELVGARMTSPAATVRARSAVEEAARIVGETGYHRLVAVDDDGRARGIVSSVDLVRALAGMPASHPPAFPHYDAETGLTWTDDTPLDLDRVEVAADGPGVIALVHGGAGVVERVVWAEAVRDMRHRLIDILSAPSSQSPALQRWLSRGSLRFRAAAQPDRAQRERVAARLRAAAHDYTRS